MQPATASDLRTDNTTREVALHDSRLIGAGQNQRSRVTFIGRSNRALVHHGRPEQLINVLNRLDSSLGQRPSLLRYTAIVAIFNEINPL